MNGIFEEKCNLCPRKCNKDRKAGEIGFCGLSFSVRLARAALHYWEEPCISGTEGSGAVFFSGCNLRCCFCQNHSISTDMDGIDITVERLAEIFLELEARGANNINLVTPSHYVLQIREALMIAKDRGLAVPIVYNSSGYDTVEELKLMESLVDIYLPDFKYMDSGLSAELSKAPDYPAVATAAIKEMIRQQPKNIYKENGMMKKGVIIRHLVLPGHVNNTKLVLDAIVKNYGTDTCVSLMNQYTPLNLDFVPNELKRKVTAREYEKAVDYMLSNNLCNGFYQEGETNSESFIPPFDYSGILKK